MIDPQALIITDRAEPALAVWSDCCRLTGPWDPATVMGQP
jgi:hypothetical protein